jgi:SAM-dependent methyltransferase
MNNLSLFWNDYRYFPYERMLGKREVEALFNTEAVEQDGIIQLKYGSETINNAKRLTYFKGARSARNIIIPDQAKLEASGNGNGASWDSETQSFPSLSRQITRYSAHGLHEYRGKFNPQVVRAIGNVLKWEPEQWVLDPFCGSGTTLLEAAHIGWNAIGTDINPLGVLIANAKLSAFNTSPTVLSREYEALIDRLASVRNNGADWQDHLPEPDYLLKWFPEKVLRQFRVILRVISDTRPKLLQDVFRVILSDICREVSLQDPGDLRIRRRKEPSDNYPAIEIFLSSLRVKINSIIKARKHIHPKKGTCQQAIFADTRDSVHFLKPFLRKYGRETLDGAITSPPYATAMPYLDTQRLSLALLGLIPSKNLRNDEKKLIGNREMYDKERVSLESQLRSNLAGLPEGVIRFCKHLLDAADYKGHGFRRRNVPALVYKYLVDMGQMFKSVRQVVRKGGRYALLVGKNATTLRGEKIQIDTPYLLSEVAVSLGWHVEEKLSFETYHRYDVHQSNSIREEELLILLNR